MKHPFRYVVIGLVALLILGCGYVRQVMSPNLGFLKPYGATSPPGQDEVVIFHDKPIDDDSFAEIFHYLESYNPQTLDLSGRQITDNSVSLLLQLNQLHELHIDGTRITPAGVKRLGHIASLRQLYISAGLLTPQEAADIQNAMIFTRLIEVDAAGTTRPVSVP